MLTGREGLSAAGATSGAGNAKTDFFETVKGLCMPYLASFLLALAAAASAYFPAS
jgi:hypothetical protein